MKRFVSVFFIFTVVVSAEIVRFKADKFSYKMSYPKQIICSGNAKVFSGTNVIYADKIIISGKNLDEAVCTGNVKLVDLESKTVLLSSKMEYYQNDDYVRLLVDPFFISKDFTIKSGIMERYNSLRLSFIQGPSVIETSNVRIKCMFGNYEEENKIARLYGPVEILHNLKSNLSFNTNRVFCNEIIFFNEENRMLLGVVSGKVWFDE